MAFRWALQPNHHQRRHSSTGVVQLSLSEYRTSADELMIGVKRSKALSQVNARSLSHMMGRITFSEYGPVRTNGMADLRSYDDMAEEKISLVTNKIWKYGLLLGQHHGGYPSTCYS